MAIFALVKRAAVYFWKQLGADLAAKSLPSSHHALPSAQTKHMLNKVDSWVDTETVCGAYTHSVLISDWRVPDLLRPLPINAIGKSVASLLFSSPLPAAPICDALSMHGKAPAAFGCSGPLLAHQCFPPSFSNMWRQWELILGSAEPTGRRKAWQVVHPHWPMGFDLYNWNPEKRFEKMQFKRKIQAGLFPHLQLGSVLSETEVPRLRYLPHQMTVLTGPLFRKF